MSLSDECDDMTLSSTVRLMAEYGRPLPLWDADKYVNLDAIDWGISAELTKELEQWQAYFDEEFSHETGWSSVDQMRVNYQEARRLKSALERELPGKTIILDFWQSSVNGVDHSNEVARDHSHVPRLQRWITAATSLKRRFRTK